MKQEMRRTFRAPGKLMLAGEYAVLESGPAVVAAVDRWATATQESIEPTGRLVIHYEAKPEEMGRFEVNRETGHVDGKPTKLLVACLERAWLVLRDHWPERLPEGTWVLESASFRAERPVGSYGRKLGLGSSAAVTVVFLGTLFESGFPGETAAVREPLLLEQAQRAHHAAQDGLGSGADIAAAVFGGLLVVRREPVSGLPLVNRLPHRPTGCKAVACYTGTSASTPKLVREIRRWAERAEEDYQSCLEELGSVSEMMCSALKDGNGQELLRSVGRGFEAMSELSSQSEIPLILPAHRQLLALSRKYGGEAKSTGAGGGDLGLAVLPADADVAAFLLELENLGLTPVPIALSPHGFESAPEDEPKQSTDRWMVL